MGTVLQDLCVKSRCKNADQKKILLVWKLKVDWYGFMFILCWKYEKEVSLEMCFLFVCHIIGEKITVGIIQSVNEWLLVNYEESLNTIGSPFLNRILKDPFICPWTLETLLDNWEVILDYFDFYFIIQGNKDSDENKRMSMYISKYVYIYPHPLMHIKILNMELSSVVFTVVRSLYIKGSHLLDRQKYK